MTYEFAGPFAVVLGVILSRHVASLMGKEPAFEMCPGLLETRCCAAYGIPAFAYARIADRVTWTERVRSNPKHCPMRGDLCAHGGGDVALVDLNAYISTVDNA